MIKEKLKKYDRAIRYLFFGVLTTLVSWITYFSILLSGKALLGLPIEDTSSAKYIAVYTAAQVFQWIAAVCFAFFTNKKWVFTDADKDQSTLKQLSIFAGGRVITFFVDYALTFFGALALCTLFPSLNCVVILGKELNVNELAAKLVCAVIVVVFNYFFSKLFVFKSKK